MAKFRNRVKEVRNVRAGDILKNPKNWRRHPEGQRNALNAVLSEIGIAGALLCWESPDGLMLIDGECRWDMGEDVEWPVVVLDVTQEEADKLLAVVDPLAGLAETDSSQLDVLLHGINTDNKVLDQLLTSIATNNGLVPPKVVPVSFEAQSRLDQKSTHICPECGHEF